MPAPITHGRAGLPPSLPFDGRNQTTLECLVDPSTELTLKTRAGQPDASISIDDPCAADGPVQFTLDEAAARVLVLQLQGWIRSLEAKR